MSADWINDKSTWPGMRVKVYLVVGNEREQRGVIERLGDLFADEGGMVGIAEDVPVIRLDDGREVGGWECYWTKDDGEGEEWE